MPASSASEKLALGKQYTNMLSLLTDCQATSSPFRLYFHLNVCLFSLFSLSSSRFSCPLLALPYANLSIGRRDGEKSIVLQSTGANELRRCGIFIGGF